MFDVGFWELALVAVIALIVLGPERLPVVARTVGRWIGRARVYARGLTSELEREFDVDGLREEVEGLRREVDRAREHMESEAHDVADNFGSMEADTRSALDDIESDTRDTFDDIATGFDDPAAAVEADDRNPEILAEAEDNDIQDPVSDEAIAKLPDDMAEFADEEPFSVERARAEHARRDRESSI